MSSMLNALKLLEERNGRQLASSSEPFVESQSSGRPDEAHATSTPMSLDDVARPAEPADDVRASTEARVAEAMEQVEQLNEAVDRELLDGTFDGLAATGAPAADRVSDESMNEQHAEEETECDESTFDESAFGESEFGESQGAFDSSASLQDEQSAEDELFGESDSGCETNPDRYEEDLYQQPAIEVGLSRPNDVYDGSSPILDESDITTYGGFDPQIFDAVPARTNLGSPLPSMLGTNQERLPTEFESDELDEPASVYQDNQVRNSEVQPSAIDGQEHFGVIDSPNVESDADASEAFAETHTEVESPDGEQPVEPAVDTLDVAPLTQDEPDVSQTMVINTGELQQAMDEQSFATEPDALPPESDTDPAFDTPNSVANSSDLPGSGVPTLRLNANSSGGVAAAWPAEHGSGGDAFAAFSAQMAQIEPDGSVSRPEPPKFETPAAIDDGFNKEEATVEDADDGQVDSPFPTSFATVFKTMETGSQLSGPDAAMPSSSIPRPMAVPFDFFGNGNQALTPESLLADEQAAESLHRIAQSHQTPNQGPAVGQSPGEAVVLGGPDGETQPHDLLNRVAALSVPSAPNETQGPDGTEPPRPTGTPFIPHIKKENSVRPTGKSPAEAALASFQPDRTAFLDSIRRHLKSRRLLTEYHTVWNSIRQNSSGGITKGNLLFVDCEADRPAAQTLIYAAATPRENDVRSVLLVDADLQSGRLSSMLSLDNAPGFSEVSLGAELEGIVKAIDLPHTHFLPAGLNRAAIDPNRIERMMAELTELYDFVLIAGGLSSNPLVPVINRACGNSFLVVRLGTSDRSAAIDTVNSLNKVGVNLGGCVVANIEADHTNF